MPFHIAIDGPVAAGKGTVARLVAEKLDFNYIDTGAMYRLVAYIAKKNHLKFTDEKALLPLVKKADMDIKNPTPEEKDGRLATIILDGKDLSWAIRTQAMSSGASQVAQLAEIRHVLVEKQQEIAKGKDVVMEGRDITYRVLPQANLKIFLTASDIVRAKRRHQQLLSKGEDADFEDVYKALIERDRRDMERSVDPLQIVDDAWVIDTSDLSIEKVVAAVTSKVEVMRGK